MGDTIMTNQIRLSLFSAVIGATLAVAPHVAVADSFEWLGAGSTFLAGLSTNYINRTSVTDGWLQRLDNSTGKYLPMISGGDLIFRLDLPGGTYDYIHVFTNATSSMVLQQGYAIKHATVLVVGGGGSGGNSGYSECGGGGGGGGAVNMQDVRLLAGKYTVSVGAGAAGSGNVGNNGGSSSFEGSFSHKEYERKITVLGGGGGGCSAGVKLVDGVPTDNTTYMPKSAGTGGGHGGNWNFGDSYNQYAPIIFPGGNGVDGQGYAGGAMIFARQTGNAAGGGGGAGGPGGNAVIVDPSKPDSSNVNGGKGGDGLRSNILGYEQYFGGGGGGGTATGWSSGGAGGAGGGGWAFGREAQGGPGTNGLGGGSGGGNSTSVAGGPGSGRGGDGIVIVRYSGEPKPTGFYIRLR